VNKINDMVSMKKLNLISWPFYILAITIFLVFGGISKAQEGNDSLSAVEKISPSLQFQVVKNNDGTRTLNASFEYRDPETREFVKVENIDLTFITGTDAATKIGVFKTDQNGKVKTILPVDYNYTRDESGLIHFAVEFDGNDKFESSSSEVDLVDLQIKLSLEIVDSIKTVKVEAAKVLANGKTEPLNEETIPIFVKRMFGYMNIGEISLADGEGTLEFPNAIPGDTLGMLTVVAKLDDHETFGNVLKSESINWGIKTSHHTVYHPRSLWTSVAPVWMIVTLSIMLLGVWGHYIYVMVELIRLKKIKKETA